MGDHAGLQGHYGSTQRHDTTGHDEPWRFKHYVQWSDNQLDHQRSVGYTGGIRDDVFIWQSDSAQQLDRHRTLPDTDGAIVRYDLSLPRKVAGCGRESGRLFQLYLYH